MRRIALLFVAIFFLGINCFAQNDNRIRTLRTNIESNNEAIQNPRRNTNIRTWLDRGRLFYDAYNVNVGFLRFGLSPMEARLYFREPREIVTSIDDGTEVETWVYSSLRLNFVDGGLRTWEETNPVVENPLMESARAFQRARELDDRGRNARRITDGLQSIVNDLEIRFFNEFYRLRFSEAYNTALERIEVNNLLGVTDTTYYFFAGFAAFAQSEIDSSMWTQAIQKFERALEIGYREVGDNRGQIYNLLYLAYIGKGNPETALRWAKTGFERYPNYEQLMYNLINYYLEREENALALEYLEQAVARDPNNAVLLFAQGRVLDELGEREKAIVAYNASIAANPTFFDAYFNLAVVFYNEAIRLMSEANDARTQVEYDRLRGLADDEFYKAIAPMEKALELNPTETSVIETLRSLYLRLRVRHPEFEAKFEEMNRRLEGLQ